MIDHSDLSPEEIDKMLSDCIERRRRKVQAIKAENRWTWEETLEALNRIAYNKHLPTISHSHLMKLMHTQTFKAGNGRMTKERCCRRLASVLHQLKHTEK